MGTYVIPRRLPDKQALGEPITIKNFVIDTIITLTALHKLTFHVEHRHGIPRVGNLQSSIKEAPRSNPLPFCVKTIKASDTLEHQPTLWPYACAQPYHPGSGSHMASCFGLVRPHQHGIAVGQKIRLYGFDKKVLLSCTFN